MKLAICLGLLCAILFLSGCISLDSKGMANQLHEARVTHVPTGLLTPETSAQRETYRNVLLGFRSSVRNIGGDDGAALNAYLDGSLSLLAMQDASQEGLILLENIDTSFIQCEKGTPAAEAILLFQDAKKYSQESYDYFTRVQKNPSIANALGADYIVNVVQTTAVLAEVHTERVDQLKSACGYSV